MSGNIRFKTNNIKYGYTLVELILVMTLIAIILSLGIPSIKTLFNTRERIELKEFKRDLVFARNSAIVENCNYIVYFYTDENRYKINKISEGITTIKDITFSNGIVMKRNTLKNSVTFHPTGAPSQGGTISLTNKKNQNIEITIEVATGKVNIYFDR